METWQRSAIKEHPRNPRRITEGARKKLRDKMKDVGLLQPLIVNRRTGYLLGGHQRLAVLDSLERYKPGGRDYSLDVAVVDLPEDQELAMLVFLNNAGAQGTWDTDALADIGGSISFDEMGFDRVDVEFLFDGDSRVDLSFNDSLEVKEAKGALAAIKEERATMKDRKTEAASVDWYVTVVCRDQAEKEKLMKHLGIPKGEVYISPAEIFALQRA